MSKHILVLGTGGTIAGTATMQAGDANYNAAQLSVAQLLLGLDGMAEALGGLGLVSSQVAQIDSKDMSCAVWCALAESVMAALKDDAVEGVVITHGTDTLEETAVWLHLMLPTRLRQRKPIVLTCAMRPATSVDADGPGNLRDAVRVAAAGVSLGLCGVVVVCASQVHHAVAVRKVHSHRLDAFDSGDWPLLAKIDGEAAFRSILINPAAILKINSTLVTGFIEFDATESGVAKALSAVQKNGLARVEIVHNHCDADGEVVGDLMRATGRVPRGFVVAGTGNGTVHALLEAALVAARGQGALVWRSTRCVLGAVSARADDVLDLTELSPAKARVAMQIQLLRQDLQKLV